MTVAPLFRIGRDAPHRIRFGRLRWRRWHPGMTAKICPICRNLVSATKRDRVAHEAHDARLLLLMRGAEILDDEAVRIGRTVTPPDEEPIWQDPPDDDHQLGAHQEES